MGRFDRYVQDGYRGLHSHLFLTTNQPTADRLRTEIVLSDLLIKISPQPRLANRVLQHWVGWLMRDGVSHQQTDPKSFENQIVPEPVPFLLVTSSEQQ